MLLSLCIEHVGRAGLRVTWLGLERSPHFPSLVRAWRAGHNRLALHVCWRGGVGPFASCSQLCILGTCKRFSLTIFSSGLRVSVQRFLLRSRPQPFNSSFSRHTPM